ncbi:CheR family methyltransferase [Chitinimonas koreensis]|uniref:CheR family methyltransferase n=1 Tax=Chitinimonas koreensis TaxID=356302 RepID=UPI0004236E8D|nr:protein-glutamate O-methyltransferase CheR [Chitinimonas koreensis]QNM98131.1 protein-glutamate O-methyltransferase CheR [Chitinimonas koreensis]
MDRPACSGPAGLPAPRAAERRSPLRTAAAAATPWPEVREFHLSDRDFQQIRSLIHAHAGISLSEHKRGMVYARLVRRLRALRLDSFAAYLGRLERDPAEWEHFTNALTTNLTRFFREPHHFDQLRQALERRGGEPARIWSAACASGEEAYSLAITAYEAGCPARILASDVDTRALDQARAGIYERARLDGVPVHLQQRYFLRGRNASEGLVRARPELAAAIAFRQLNLRETQWPMRRRFDAIFCRNALIYFDRPTQAEVLQRMLGLLAPGGLLFLGHSETLHGFDLPLRPVGTTVYQHEPAGPAGSGHDGAPAERG